MYHRKLLKELADNSDIRIKKFLYDYKDHYPFCQISLLQLYETVIDEIFHYEDEKSTLRKLGNLEHKKRKKNKQRWFAKLTDSLHNETIPICRHPFGSTILIYQNYSRSEWNLQFQSKSLSEVLQDKYNLSKIWMIDPSIRLTSYPAILSLSIERVYKALKSDIAIDICNTIEEKYNGSITDFWHIWPNEMIDIPLFSPKQLKLNYTLSDFGKLINQLIFGMGARLTISINPSTGTYYYETVVNRLKKYPYYTYQLEDPMNPNYHCITFNIFDNVSIQQDSMGHIQVTVKPASYLAEQIINNQITFISRKEANSLSLPLSKILMFKIQRERVLIFLLKSKTPNNKETYSYHYSFFDRATRLPYNTKSQNLQAISQALQEMVEHNIFVRSFKQSGNRFYIDFYPLSKEEQEDFHAVF